MLASSTLFRSEADWPFVLRQPEHNKCLTFLTQENTQTPRLLRIFGPSGSGKSFLARQLLTDLATQSSTLGCLYIDISSDELAASTFPSQIDRLLVRPRTADRASPNFVSRALSSSWFEASHRTHRTLNAYFYRVARDLTNQIPIIGPFIKAILPDSIPYTQSSQVAPSLALRFFIEKSVSKRCVLALDNVQFLPPLLRETLEDELYAAGIHFILITIERVIENKQDWMPSIPNLIAEDIDLLTPSAKDLVPLVSSVLPEEYDIDALSETIYRRSDGNLKSVWLQLKYITERRSGYDFDWSTNTYEAVIGSLSPIDQAVLRIVVFLLGGLSISQIVALFSASYFPVRADTVETSIADLAALGLLVINSEHRDRVKIEHEMVAHAITALTPEEEKLELRQQLVEAISGILKPTTGKGDVDTLYDKLIGILNEEEVRSSPNLQALIVQFIERQSAGEQFFYLANMFRDSVCWDILDLLPSHSIRILLNSIQKCSRFDFGLVATEKLKHFSNHKNLAILYEAKYLVQLFRYEDAKCILKQAPDTTEKACILFNVMLNLVEDEGAEIIANQIYDSLSASSSEFEYAILRNSGHLFSPRRAREILTVAANGFRNSGSQFGFATALNNLGIVEIFNQETSRAKQHFDTALKILSSLQSNEVYQPLVNLSALAVIEGKTGFACKLLSAARESVSHMLPMDVVMLDFNGSVIDLLAGTIPTEEILPKFRQLQSSATKTRDIRFVEVVTWFCATLEKTFNITPTVVYNRTLIENIFRSNRAGVELFTKIRTNGVELNAPYILSPNWRY